MKHGIAEKKKGERKKMQSAFRMWAENIFPQSLLPVKEAWPFWNWAGLKQSGCEVGL